MENEDKNNIIDIEFTEDKSVKFIKGKPLYYKTNDVAELLEENPSTIRFWAECFKDFLNIELSGRNRKFKEVDIEKLRYIKKLLREDNLTINQVKQYCSEEDMSIIESKMKQSEPIMIQSIASAITMEVATYMDEFKESLGKQVLQEIQDGLIQQQNSLESFQSDLKEHIAITIAEEVKSNVESIKGYIDEKELQARQRDIDMLETLKKNMEEQKKLNEQKSRGFFGKLFGK